MQETIRTHVHIFKLIRKNLWKIVLHIILNETKQFSVITFPPPPNNNQTDVFFLIKTDLQMFNECVQKSSKKKKQSKTDAISLRHKCKDQIPFGILFAHIFVKKTCSL